MTTETVLFCQSCAMPLTEEKLFGANADGSKNEDYCCYCFQSGSFTSDVTMDEMIELCLNIEKDLGLYQDREEEKKRKQEWFPSLKRWKTEKE